MKKCIGLLSAVMFICMAVGISWSHSDWAKYQFIPVPYYVQVPQKLINDDGTLDCCGCHWNTNHAGPGKGFCDDE